ncbi:MAG: SgcJ/EcaC family oxidoreductase [Acidimicrobiales bacterium]|nr:SgcJ/EcaC family oxidoreductase [Acidimicrobiales bacterium]
MLTPNELRSLIADYVDAINAREAHAIAALFTEDAVHADPVSNPPNVGRAAITAFFEAGISASRSWTFTAKEVHTCGAHVAVDFGISVATGGSSMTIDGIEVFVADDDGLFISAHAYWDDADLTFGAEGTEVTGAEAEAGASSGEAGGQP